jgi:Universal stress protein UspA and related nucleotide-binding proteins
VTQPQPPARIVVGLDRNGSHNDTVLAAALGQARLTKAAVSLVHAIAPETPTTAASLDVAASQDRRAARKAHHDAATEDLHRLLANSPRDGDAPVTVDYDVRHGDPATVLLAAAQHANLIVIGTHGTGGGSPLLLGTVSQDVAVHATCPVLLIPTP